jgi:hypothetical protein
MNIHIKKFDPDTIDPCRVCIFIGKRGTGKSQLVTDILYHKRKVPMGVVMSGTEESNEHYKDFIPDTFIYGQYEPPVIEKIIKRQRDVVKKIKSKDEKSITNNVFILLDDCMYDNKWTRDVNIRGIFMNGRHWKILFMITMQYCMDLPPSLRANIDYVFILRENIIQNREKLYKHFFGIFPTFDSFNEVMNQCTENYECLVLDNTSKSNKIEDTVFWYKAKVGRKFKMGAPELWEHHKRNYNPKYDEPQDLDPKALNKKSKTPPVIVTKTDTTGKKKRTKKKT